LKNWIGAAIGKDKYWTQEVKPIQDEGERELLSGMKLE
jgi:hypothetical protein